MDDDDTNEVGMGELMNEMQTAIASGSDDALDDVAERAVAATADDDDVVAVLNELLVCPGHQAHQRVARALQRARSPSTIAFVRRAIDGGFGYLDYTCSDPDVLTKWFSWILHDIGTPEAIETIRFYATSNDADVQREMAYRLRRIDSRPPS